MARYTVKYAPCVVAFFRTLCPRSQQAIRDRIDDLRQCPQLGDPIRTAEGLRYVKTYDGSRIEFPHGIRIVYAWYETALIIAVVDLGSHDTSAAHPGRSVYQDERAEASLVQA